MSGRRDSDRRAADRLRAEEAAADRARLTLAIEATGLGIWEWNAQTGATHWSDRQKEIWGLLPHEIASYDYWRASLHPDDRERVLAAVQRTLDPSSSGYLRLEHRILLPDGRTRWILSRGRMVYEESSGRPLRLIGTALDDTRRRKHDQELQEALARNQILMREVNHRIKNSLQLVSAMLALQGARSSDTEVRRIVREAQSRLQIVAAVHERLYRSEDLEQVDLADFIETLCRDIEQAGVGEAASVAIQVVAEKVAVGNDCAVPVALILNELVTNAIKHACPGGNGSVQVRLEKVGDALRLSVTDSGPGLPPDFAERQRTSLGFRVIKGLVGQIHGRLHILQRRPGTCFRITFSP